MTTSPASPSRVVFGAAVLAVPLIGLALVLARPDLDLRWEHHPAHFWLVLGSAIVSAVLAYATGEAAARRGDARLFYVSLAFLSSSGFLALHALATPGVVLFLVGFTVVSVLAGIVIWFASQSARKGRTDEQLIELGEAQREIAEDMPSA